MILRGQRATSSAHGPWHRFCVSRSNFNLEMFILWGVEKQCIKNKNQKQIPSTRMVIPVFKLLTLPEGKCSPQCVNTAVVRCSFPLVDVQKEIFNYLF